MEDKLEAIMLKKFKLLVILLLFLTSAGFAKPEKGKAWIASYLRNKPVKTTPVKENVIRTLKKGEEFKILNFSKGWYLIETEDGAKGWIYRKLIKVYDINSNELDNYNPYNDKAWKEEKLSSTEPSFPKKQNEKDKEKTPETDKPVKDTVIQKKMEKEVKKQEIKQDEKQLELADSIINIGQRIDSLETRINDLEKSGVSSSQITQINNSITNLQKQQKEIIEQYEDLGPGEDSNLLLWVLIVCILIGIVIISRITGKNRKMLEEQNTNLKSSIQTILRVINNNFNKVEIINREDFSKLIDVLEFIINTENQTVKNIFKAIEKSGGDYKEIPETAWQQISSSEFSELLEKILRQYIEFETSSPKKGRANSLLKDKNEQLKEVKNFNKPDYKADKKQ